MTYNINTPTDFATALLEQLGAPVTPVNLTTVTQWEQHEGGNWQNTAAFNPLNTTLRLPGSSVLPGGGPAANAGVQAYQSWDQGLTATVQTLQESQYAQIVADLRSSAPTTKVAADIGSSPWGTPNWTGSGGGQAVMTAGGSAPPPTQASALVNDGSVSYWPSVVGGVPAIPPSLNPLGNNPIGDLASVLDFGVRWSGWAIFTAMVFVLGVVLFLIGLAILGVVLFGPAAGAVASASPVRAVTRTVKGRRREARAEATHQRRREERTTDREHAAAVKRSVKPVSRPLDERPFQQSERTLKARPPGKKKAA